MRHGCHGCRPRGQLRHLRHLLRELLGCILWQCVHEEMRQQRTVMIVCDVHHILLRRRLRQRDILTADDRHQRLLVLLRTGTLQLLRLLGNLLMRLL